MIVNFICSQFICTLLHRENGSFEVLSLHTSQDEYCTTELYLSVDKLKKKNKQQGRQRQGRDGVSVQMSKSV